MTGSTCGIGASALCWMASKESAASIVQFSFRKFALFISDLAPLNTHFSLKIFRAFKANLEGRKLARSLMRRFMPIEAQERAACASTMVKRIRQAVSESVLRTICAFLYLLALAFPTLPAVCMAQGLSGTTTRTISEPSSYEGLLRNLKIALDDGSLARREFLSDQDLLELFGKGRVIWHEKAIEKFSGEIRRPIFYSVGDPARGRSSLDDAIVSFRRTLSGNGQLETMIVIDLITDAPDRPSFSQIEQIFGDQWQLEQYQAPNPHLTVSPRTAPHGNDIVTYGKGTETELLFHFSPDARIKYARAWMSRATK